MNLNIKDSSYFLSSKNPLATIDQRELEEFAIELLSEPAIKAAKEQAVVRWKTLLGQGAPKEAWRTFDEVIDEWVFNYVLKAVNSDPNYPKVLRHIFSPPHRWFGRDVPGNRGFGGENPDSIYTIIPIETGARYRLHGQCFARGLDIALQITSSPTFSATLDSLEINAESMDEDGCFTVLLGPERDEGCANYLQTKLDALYLLIRDSQASWLDTPNAYRVERLDPPGAAKLTKAQIIERAARNIVQEVATAHFWIAMISAIPVNAFTPAFVTGIAGGMYTARMSMARFSLKDDEAVVVKIKSVEAKYRGLVLMDFWQHSLSASTFTSSMNIGQCDVSDDGGTICVISAKDPGIYNWVNTMGLSEPRLMMRWHGLPEQHDPSLAMPWVESHIVKFTELPDVLPSNVLRITEEERKQQLLDRQAAFETRFLDS